MQEALLNFKQKSLGKNYELNHLSKSNMVNVYSSSDASLLVGTIPFASVEDADRVFK